MAFTASIHATRLPGTVRRSLAAETHSSGRQPGNWAAPLEGFLGTLRQYSHVLLWHSDALHSKKRLLARRSKQTRRISGHDSGAMNGKKKRKEARGRTGFGAKDIDCSGMIV